MAKALYGFLGEPRASMLLRQVSELQKRVLELEKALEASEAEAIALRAIVETKVETAELEDARALA